MEIEVTIKTDDKHVIKHRCVLSTDFILACLVGEDGKGLEAMVLDETKHTSAICAKKFIELYKLPLVKRLQKMK